VTRPLLKRLPLAGRFDKKYQVHGFDHLIVEACYTDGEEHRLPQFMYWTIEDTRFTPRLDKWRRAHVLVVPNLSVARSWLRAGGASLWDPEKRLTDKSWKPIPDGWSIEEARGEVPSRAPAGSGDGIRLGPERRRDREVRREDGRADRRGDSEPGNQADRVELKDKRFAVCPGYVRSADGDLHWIDFGALTWLYGVKPAECIKVDDRWESGHRREDYEHLIWLYPQQEVAGYAEMKRELARGEDAFKLVEP
jgi:hypothetical protein